MGYPQRGLDNLQMKGWIQDIPAKTSILVSFLNVLNSLTARSLPLPQSEAYSKPSWTHKRRCSCSLHTRPRRTVFPILRPDVFFFGSASALFLIVVAGFSDLEPVNAESVDGSELGWDGCLVFGGGVDRGSIQRRPKAND
jgi:hypothetical protein